MHCNYLHSHTSNNSRSFLITNPRIISDPSAATPESCCPFLQEFYNTDEDLYTQTRIPTN